MPRYGRLPYCDFTVQRYGHSCTLQNNIIVCMSQIIYLHVPNGLFDRKSFSMLHEMLQKKGTLAMKTYVPNQSVCLILKCFGYSGYSGYSTCFTKLPYEPWDIYWSNAKKSLSLHRIQLHVQTTYSVRNSTFCGCIHYVKYLYLVPCPRSSAHNVHKLFTNLA